MGILRQLNDELIGKLELTRTAAKVTSGDDFEINIGDEFRFNINVKNVCGGHPQITFTDVALEVVPHPLFATIKGAANDNDSKRFQLGTIEYNQTKTVTVDMVAKNILGIYSSEPVATTKIAANVLLRCKDLDNPYYYVQIHED